MVSTLVLYHLPDFWKAVGLQRVAKMVKPGGKFYLSDVVFSFKPTDYESRFDGWVKAVGEACNNFEEEAIGHIRDEYSTCGWVMEGMLEKAGFAIEEAKYRDEYFADYVCSRK